MTDAPDYQHPLTERDYEPLFLAAQLRQATALEHIALTLERIYNKYMPTRA